MKQQSILAKKEWLQATITRYDRNTDFDEQSGQLLPVTNRNEKAIELFKQLLIAGKEAGRRRSVRNALINLGTLYYTEGNKEQLDITVKEFNEYVKGRPNDE